MGYFASGRRALPLAALVLAGCGAPPPARNIEPVAAGAAYQAQYRAFAANVAEPILISARMNAEKCRPAGAGAAGESAGKLGQPIPRALLSETLTRGDLLELRLPADEEFSADYVISRDGTLKLPYIAPIPAQGRTPEAVLKDVLKALVAGGFYAEAPQGALLLKDFAQIRVAVSGAVFEPQAMTIGGVQGDQVDSLRQQALGAYTESRNLSVALRAAGGIRPDADLSAVRLTRAGTNYILDLSGMVTGHDAPDVILVTGDEVYVPTRQCFQDDLMTPSPVSPPGISLYLSNLTQPATGNAPSAVGQTVREVPYGTRFMQAVVDTNCVGGARATSAHRSAALFSRNPMTGVSVVIERPIEEMRARADRDDYDPYLLPGDAIACYDSSITNIAEVGKVLGIFGLLTVLD